MDMEMKDAERPPKRQRYQSDNVPAGGRKWVYKRSYPRYKRKKQSKTKRAVIPYEPKVANGIHPFTESFFLTQLTSASGPGLGYTFSLSNVTDFASYRALFEEFRFDRVTITASSTQTEAIAQGAAQYMPTLYVAVDPNDGVAPASLDEVLQTGRWKQYQLHSPTIIADFVPTLLGEVQASAGVTTTVVTKKTWISLENVAIQHNGLKIWLDPVLTGNGGITLVVTYQFAMRFGK